MLCLTIYLQVPEIVTISSTTPNKSAPAYHWVHIFILVGNLWLQMTYKTKQKAQISLSKRVIVLHDLSAEVDRLLSWLNLLAQMKTSVITLSISCLLPFGFFFQQTHSMWQHCWPLVVLNYRPLYSPSQDDSFFLFSSPFLSLN